MALPFCLYFQPALLILLLKIPHHGSDESANSGFYQNFRAEVYLICGSDHAQKSGNPTFSSLKAIVSGFEGKAVSSIRARVLLLLCLFSLSQLTTPKARQWSSLPDLSFRPIRREGLSMASEGGQTPKR